MLKRMEKFKHFFTTLLTGAFAEGRVVVSYSYPPPPFLWRSLPVMGNRRPASE